MNKIDKDELFGHVSQFLKNKGVELQEGAYSRTIQKGCQVLADTINLSQQAMERAKSELEKTLEQARQVIHQKTAPKPSPGTKQPSPATQPFGAAAKPAVGKRMAKRSLQRPPKRRPAKPSNP